MPIKTYSILGRERIAILGAGEFGKQAAHYILQNDKNKRIYEIAGWYDDTKEKGSYVEGYPILGSVDDVIAGYQDGKFDSLFIAIGYLHLEFKEFLIRKLKNRVPLFNIISKDSYVDPTCLIGNNIFIYPGAIIDKETILEDGVTVNLGSIVSHNSNIGASTFIAPGVTIAGFSEIGKTSFIGIGSTIKDNIRVCDNVIIGAGSLVVKNILVPGTYIGIPTKLLKK